MHSRAQLPQHGIQQHQQFLNKFNHQQEFKQSPTIRPVLGIPNIPQRQALSQLPVLQQNAMLNVNEREITFGIMSYTGKEQPNRYQYTSQYYFLHQHSIQQQCISQSTYGALKSTEQTHWRQIQLEKSLRNNGVSQRADDIFKAISPNCSNALQVESTNIQSDQKQQLLLHQQSQDQSSANNREQFKSFTVAPQCNSVDADREIDEIWKKIEIIQRDRRQIQEQVSILAKPFQLPNVRLAKAQPNTMQYDQQQIYSQTPLENTLTSTFCMASSTQQLQQYEVPQIRNYTNSSQDNQSRQEQKMSVNHAETCLSKINESQPECDLNRDRELKPKLFHKDDGRQELQNEVKANAHRPHSISEVGQEIDAILRRMKENEVKANAHRPHSISEVGQEIDAILRRMKTMDRHQKRKEAEAFKTGKILQLLNVKSKKGHRALRQVSALRQSQRKLQQKQENCQTLSDNVLIQNNNYMHSHQTTQSHQGRQIPIKHKKDQTQSSVQDYKFNQQNNFSSAIIPGKNSKLFREHEDLKTILNDFEEINRTEQQKHEAKSNIVDALQFNQENSIFEICVQAQIAKLLTDVSAIKNLSSGKLQQIQLNQLLHDMELINLELRKWSINNTKTKNQRLLQMMKLYQNNLQTISELTKLKKKEKQSKCEQKRKSYQMSKFQQS